MAGGAAEHGVGNPAPTTAFVGGARRGSERAGRLGAVGADGAVSEVEVRDAGGTVRATCCGGPSGNMQASLGALAARGAWGGASRFAVVKVPAWRVFCAQVGASPRV